MKQEGWGVGRLALVLYPFGAGAAVINLFMLGLFGTWLGFPAMQPLTALWVGALLGLPLTWWFARHIRGLMDKADAEG
ncbi:NnrT protein [Pararhodobacter oceanensis]|uniref:NnrT protein n=1 Tax=Pararhodobacter oceanensis TaxID=2172121 RepID=UPI003A8FEA53